MNAGIAVGTSTTTLGKALFLTVLDPRAPRLCLFITALPSRYLLAPYWFLNQGNHIAAWGKSFAIGDVFFVYFKMADLSFGDTVRYREVEGACAIDTAAVGEATSQCGAVASQ